MKHDDICGALAKLRPQSHWVLHGDDYTALQWFDDPATKPTLKEVEAAIATLVVELPRDVISELDALKRRNDALEAALFEKTAVTKEDIDGKAEIAAVDAKP